MRGTTGTAARRSSRWRVYPHMRGDHRNSYAVAPGRQVYPHMRGDTVVTFDTTVLGGSTPTWWGPRVRGQGGAQHDRSNPHSVGTTSPSAPTTPPLRVYPPMRGDHREQQTAGRRAGLPPHAWGPPNRTRIALNLTRSTPTCVGTTTGSRGLRSLQSGLPPHAWGPLRRIDEATREHRSTPTCVGTTRPAPRRPDTARVYPHMRGDHSSPSAGRATPSGLPPHAWGPLVSAGELRLRDGSTPTCVGTTWSLNLRRL